MKISLENIGLIDKAEIELAELTIICGENNTGKTYATYALYGFLRTWRSYLLRVVYKTTMRNVSQRKLQFDLKEMSSGQCNKYLQQISDMYSKSLPQAFGASATSSALQNGKISVSIKEPEYFENEYRRVVEGGSPAKIIATLGKAKGSNLLELLIG